MAHRKAFSLIETLAAIVIASISAIALLQAVSTASRHASEVVENFDRSVMSGAVIGSIDADMYGRTLSASEILQTRYSIDDPDLLEVLNSQTFSIEKVHDEILDPMNSLSTLSSGSFPLLLEEITIKNTDSDHTDHCFRIAKTGNAQ